MAPKHLKRALCRNAKGKAKTMTAPTKVAQAGSHEAGRPFPRALRRSPAGRAGAGLRVVAEALLVSRHQHPHQRPPLCFGLGKELEPPRPQQLCSSCRGQTPILCPGPWGCGLNTTKTFFSFMNALSGSGLPFPGEGGTRRRREQPLVPHLLPGGVEGTAHP